MQTKSVYSDDEKKRALVGMWLMGFSLKGTMQRLGITRKQAREWLP